MRKLAVVLLVAMCATGCDKLKGDKGDTGAPGPGSITTYQGVVTSDSFIVSTPAVTLNSQIISVYICDAADCSELPYWLPGVGANTFFTASVGSVLVVNAAAAGGTTYRITVINP